MKCQEFWNTMPEFGGPEPGGAEQHLSECAACAARMARQRELADGLRAVAASERRVSAPSRVEGRLVAAFRRQSGLQSGPRRGFRWAPVFSWAATVAAMIALAVFAVRQQQPQAARTGAEAAIASSSDSVQSDYDGFIPLPSTGKLDTEDVNVVRVEVPRSAMIAVGLEVNPDRASELVQAEVMLGPDGLARAVKFLDAESSL